MVASYYSIAINFIRAAAEETWMENAVKQKYLEQLSIMLFY